MRLRRPKLDAFAQVKMRCARAILNELLPRISFKIYYRRYLLLRNNLLLDLFRVELELIFLINLFLLVCYYCNYLQLLLFVIGLARATYTCKYIVTSP